jgi:hypothetical protein
VDSCSDVAASDGLKYIREPLAASHGNSAPS